MPKMTILEAAEYFGVSKEAIHNRVRRGSLTVTLVDNIKMVEVDTTNKKPASRVRQTIKKELVGDRYYQLLEEQNKQLQGKVDKLEGETRSLRNQKEEMLLQERIKIEQVYKDKDEQLKNILTTLSSQFMLNTPLNAQVEHLDAEIEEETKPLKGELISLKNYLKKYSFSEKKQKKIKVKFEKKAKKDERIIVIKSKYYLDTLKFDYKDLLK